jgi:two-component system, response regulator PdtaR
MAKPVMLVVEDNLMSRTTAVEIFEDLGFTIFDAYNGQRALALLEASPEIGLLFIDVRMPGMSGPELAGAVGGRSPNIRVVLTSGFVGEEDVPKGSTFVPKPWRMDQVARAVGLQGSS